MPRSASSPIRVSILVCTKDRPVLLQRALPGLLAAAVDVPHTEVLVIREGDQTPLDPRVRVVEVPARGRGFGYTRNLAVRSAKGSLLVFIDDDCQVAPGWLDALLRPFEDPSVLGVAGAILVEDCNRTGYAESILGFPGGGLKYLDAVAGRVNPTQYLSTCNCAYRRSAILAAGGFSEAARSGGEDSLLAAVVTTQGRCVYTPHAIACHAPRGTLRGNFRWFLRRGFAETQLLGLQHGTGQAFRQALRCSLFVRLLVVLAGCSLFPALVPGTPFLPVVYYLLLLWRYRFCRKYHAHRGAWWWVPVVKTAMDTGADVGRWKAVWGRASA